MSDTVEQVKSRLDIVDVISGYLKLRKAGSGWKARCPFHNEKTPSFHISPERQTWHCFGCNKGGDLFSFVQEIDGLDFPEALRILAARAGVPLPEHGPEDRAERQQRRRLLQVLDLSEKFFAKQLWHGTAGAKALAYLKGRGMEDATVQAWKLGWAPNDWRALTEFLRGAGMGDDDIVAAGMAIKKNDRVYDRFRSRIMFPIADTNGQTVGFTGRAYGASVAPDGEAPAKYVNTPQTSVYDKSRVVFGLHLAKNGMREHDAALLVEGNMDAIMAWQSGATNAVAVSGTALTPQQLRMIGRHTMNLDVCFDADQAGQGATRRGIGLALAADMRVRVLALDDASCKDPADYVAKHGTKFAELATTAVPALRYYYDRAKGALDPKSASSKRDAVKSLGPLIRRLASKVEQSHWIDELAQLVRADHASVAADVAAVYDDIAAAERGMETDEPQTAPAKPVLPPDPASVEIAAILARDPSLAPQAEPWIELVDARVALLVKEPKLLAARDADAELRPVIESAHQRAEEFYVQIPEAQLSAALESIGAFLRERDLRTKRAQLEFDISAAEQQKDSARVRELVGTFQQYTEEINRLQSIQSPTTTT
ncbi:MAG TPA: DNA primase [Candidatus Paceibacterota bacterium]|nr:DNA primase [Candidatus Paceibacterota bacterium]